MKNNEQDEMFDDEWSGFAKTTMDVIKGDLEYSKQLKIDAKAAGISEDKKYFLCVLKENDSLVVMQSGHLLDYRTREPILLMTRQDAQRLVDSWNEKSKELELKCVHFSHFASDKFEENKGNYHSFSRIFKRELAA